MLYVWEPSLPPLMIYLCIPDSISSANICKYMMVSNKRICIFVPKKTGLLKGYDDYLSLICFLNIKYRLFSFDFQTVTKSWG